MENVKTLIIGSGPAGYTAAIYLSRANLAPVLYEGIQPGGQLTTTTQIENYPGFADGIDANELMTAMRKQAENLGTTIRTGSITRVDLSSRPFRIEVEDGTEIAAESLIVATGATAKYLGLPSELKFRGQGVSACATCDGFFYRKRDVAVVGGGDTACEEATYLASLCRQVYMIVRKPYLRASQAMQQRVFDTPNIEVLFEPGVRHYANSRIRYIKKRNRRFLFFIYPCSPLLCSIFVQSFFHRAPHRQMYLSNLQGIHIVRCHQFAAPCLYAYGRKQSSRPMGVSQDISLQTSRNPLCRHPGTECRL